MKAGAEAFMSNGPTVLHQSGDPSRRSERGVALVVVLLLIAILAALASEIVYESRIQMMLVRNYQDYLRAHYVAKAGVNLAKGLLNRTGGPFENTGIFQNDFINLFRCECMSQATGVSSGLSDQQNHALQSQTPATQTGPGSQVTQEGCGLWKLAINYPIEDDLLDMTLTDEQTRLNLNALVVPSPTADEIGAAADTTPQGVAFRQALRTLFLYQANRHGLTLNETDADSILDYLVDWMDYGIFDKKFDKEDRGSTFEDGDRVYSLKNGPLDTVDELRMIPGMTDDLFNAVRDYLTVYTVDKEFPKLFFSNKVNLQLASQEVLLALFCAGQTPAGQTPQGHETCKFDDALTKVQELINGGITTNGWLQPRPIPTELQQFQYKYEGAPRTYRIVASGITQSGVVATIVTVVRQSTTQQGLQIVYWSEN
jgi:type II secretory pathway component PulK